MIQADSLINDIKQTFPGFSQALIEDILTNAESRTFEAGEIIMRSGQYIKNTVLVTKGKIKIYREDEDGGEFFMYYLQPGQACAISMICTIKSEKSQISARVVEDTEVIAVPLQIMDKFMMSHRTWYEFVIDTYRNRFEEVLLVIDSIAFKALDERLEFYLKRQSEACQCSEITISHHDIANDLNTSREVISRLLKKMEQKGQVELNRNQIKLLYIKT